MRTTAAFRHRGMTLIELLVATTLFLVLGGILAGLMSQGMESFRNLIYAFYTPGFSFANFIREHPEHRDRLTDILIGDVFKEGVDEIFLSMKNFCDLPDAPPPLS